LWNFCKVGEKTGKDKTHPFLGKDRLWDQENEAGMRDGGLNLQPGGRKLKELDPHGSPELTT
jgi:hypothetical protein